MFSPFYAEARSRSQRADPLAHCSMNVALYGRSRDLWAFTERDRSSVRREANALVIGPSAMRWYGGELAVDFDEITAPFGSRLAGRVRLFPDRMGDGRPVAIDAEGKHRWLPIAPAARAEVELWRPAIRFRGAAYFDTNRGDRGLEEDFSGWSWSRVTSPSRSLVTYDVARRDGSRLLLARSFERDGRIEEGVTVSGHPIRRTGWGMRRTVHAGPERAPALLRTLEDTPFYARSLIEASYRDERATGTHEALSLDRWKARWVQWLLPYRMRRAPG